MPDKITPTELKLRASLLQLIKYARWQMTEGATHHPTLPSAVAEAQALLDATR